MAMLNLYDLSRTELALLVEGWGFSEYYADLIWVGLYRNRVRAPEEIIGLRPELTRKLGSETRFYLPTPLVEQKSEDRYTRKFLLKLEDEQAIETVIMRFQARKNRPLKTRRFTACLSTQAGCAMGCIFCATGQMGFKRHLTAGEIVGQVVFVQNVLARDGYSLRNIVLMGMGEPLHNYDQTMKAVDMLTDPKGIGLAPRHITLSTVGLPPAIRRLADENRQINLAVSLHGATDAERSTLVPPARRWPLAELIDACRYYIDRRQRRIFFEWALIDQQNDTPAQAHRLGRLLKGMMAHVNVIPLNPTDGYSGRPSNLLQVKQFQKILAEYGLPSTVRQQRGIDIAAGCGQLANKSGPGRVAIEGREP